MKSLLTIKDAVLGVFVSAWLITSCATPQQSLVYRHVGGQRRLGSLIRPEAYALYLKGEIFFSQKKYERSIAAFKQCLSDGPRDPYVLSRLAEALYRSGDHDDAHDLIEDSLEDFPHSEALWASRARFADAEGRLYKAVASYVQAERWAEGDSRVTQALSATLRKHGLRQRADAILQEHLRWNGASSLSELQLLLRSAANSDDVQAASSAAEHLLDVAPARADDVRQIAREAYDKKQFTVAAALLEQVSRDASDEVLRIEALVAAGYQKRALAILNTSSPGRFGGEIVMARLFLALNEAERCLELANVAVASETQLSEAHWLKGRALEKLGRQSQSALQYAQVAAGSSSFTSARLQLASLLEQRGMSKQAQAVLRKTIEENPEKSFDLRVRLAEIEMKSSRPQEALALFQQPRDLLHRIYRAFLLERAGDLEGAIQIFLSAPEDQLQELPSRYRVRCKAEQDWNAERKELAIARLSKWLAQSPEDYSARLRLLEFLKLAQQEQRFVLLYEESVSMTFPNALSDRFAPLIPETATQNASEIAK